MAAAVRLPLGKSAKRHDPTPTWVDGEKDWKGVMRALIIGGAGMIGRKLAERLAREGELGGQALSSLTLYDVAEAAVPAGRP